MLQPGEKIHKAIDVSLTLELHRDREQTGLAGTWLARDVDTVQLYRALVGVALQQSLQRRGRERWRRAGHETGLVRSVRELPLDERPPQAVGVAREGCEPQPLLAARRVGCLADRPAAGERESERHDHESARAHERPAQAPPALARG